MIWIVTYAKHLYDVHKEREREHFPRSIVYHDVSVSLLWNPSVLQRNLSHDLEPRFPNCGL